MILICLLLAFSGGSRGFGFRSKVIFDPNDILN